MSNKENIRPRFSIKPQQRRERTIRHHNPGTRRQTNRDPRVRLLSSIVVVPPTNHNAVPSTSNEAIHCAPSASPIINPEDLQIPERFEPPSRNSSSGTPWRTPDSIGIPPTHSPWREARSLVPTSMVDYSEGFHIVPGEAYQPVPLYVNRDIPWKLTPIENPTQRRVRFYRNDSSDPRMHDLRVEVTPIDPPQPISPPRPQEPETLLFEPPHRPTSSPVDTPDVLAELIGLLDRTYGCPRPPPERTRRAPSTSTQAETFVPQPSTSGSSRISDSLQALVQLAKLFAGPRDSTEDEYRKFKRPHCRRRD